MKPALFVHLARPERFELPTNWFEASYSIQLSYGRAAAAMVSRTVGVGELPPSRQAGPAARALLH